ncbi:MAG: carboxypeptidase regulatory-like domain-containing protein [Gemmatimonadaceae bacterium]
MIHLWSARRRTLVCASAIAFMSCPLAAQGRQATGTVSGAAVSEAGTPLADVTVSVERNDSGETHTAVTDERGGFRVGGLNPGLYRVTARRIGHRVAQLHFLRVMAGQTAEIRVTLSASPTLLSTVEVRSSPTSIDVATSELTRRIEVADVALVPMGRTAASLVELVPGVRNGFVWGGAGEAANNYQLDGVAVNHPGIGGDFLAPSIDWIESLELRGLGAGAEHGAFQGAIINAITKTGSNVWRGALRSHYISPRLTDSNILPNEEGAEQSMRREFSGDMRGPIVRDRLFYFLGAIVTDRNVQVPQLLTVIPDDVRPVEQQFRDLRGIGKLTLRPGPLDRLDALVGHTSNRAEHANLDGIDDPAASNRVRSPTTFYEAIWARTGLTSSLDAKLAGFTSSQSTVGYAGDSVPAVQVFSAGRQPVFQNAIFSERTAPRSLGGNLTYRKEHAAFGGVNRLVVGGEYTRGFWKKARTRNGGMTWLPYVNPATGTVNPLDAASWVDAANEWGGEVDIDSEIEDLGLFFQNYLSIRPNFTITPGVRVGRWKGWLAGDRSQAKFLAASDARPDGRIGMIWDLTGRNDFVVKAHLGTYHQSMSSLFFDRAAGSNSYTNEHFYFQGPPIGDSRTTFTPAQRDARLDTFTGFSPTYLETILNEAGSVENFRQPYVRQTVLSIEKELGQRWKVEVSFANRVNKDIVGLVDRNLDQNYSLLPNVAVRDRVTQQPIFDQFGNPLVLPQVWISNYDLVRALIRRRDGFFRSQPPLTGFSFADIDRLKFEPDIALTTLPGARRRTNQLSASVRTEQQTWSAFASATFTDIRGNVEGLTGFATTRSGFTAGPGVRRNEGINTDGRLGGIPAFDTKAWLTGQLPWGIRGGLFTTFTLGEYITPGFQITPRYQFLLSDRSMLEDSLFAGVLGQSILIEERGARKYPSYATVDLRGEKRFTAGGLSYVISGDVFNALASDAIVQRNLSVNDAVSKDPTSLFGAPRRRAAPLRLQVGFRIER